jgi:cytochrome b6-f complex iron-sulfur subunit
MSEKKQPNRRELLKTVGIGTGLVALVAQTGAALRSLVPNVSYDAPTTVKLGLPPSTPKG